MKYANTRMGQNFDTLQRYKKVYYHLIENELPILKGGERKKLAKRAEQTKNAILISFCFLFFWNKRIGFINRLFLCMVGSQGLVYLTKSNFYRQCVEELNYEMTLTGQESRILTQYYFNAHPQNEAYKSLCSKYKEHSENQKKIENARRHLLTESMEKQKNQLNQ